MNVSYVPLFKAQPMFFQGRHFFLPCEVRSMISKWEIKITDESRMNTMGEHGVCPLHIDWRDNTQGRAFWRAGWRAHTSHMWGCSIVRKLAKNLSMDSGGKKGKKNKKKNKTALHLLRVWEGFFFLSTLPKPQCSLFSELYKHYIMHIGHVKSSFTV